VDALSAAVLGLLGRRGDGSNWRRPWRFVDWRSDSISTPHRFVHGWRRVRRFGLRYRWLSERRGWRCLVCGTSAKQERKGRNGGEQTNTSEHLPSLD
jgi:hypothetical protein